MPKTRIVTTNGDGTYKDIVATIPLHFLRVYADNDRNALSINYKTPDDNFTAVFTTDVSIGDIIERIGPGKNGLLGIPPAFSASGQTGTILLKVKMSDNSAKDLTVYESENPL